MLFAVAINIMVVVNLGASPWVVFEIALTKYFPITLGQATIIVAFFITLLDVGLRQPLGWGTLANMISIGLFVDWLKPIIPVPPPNLWLSTPYLLLGVMVMGFATAIYVSANAGAGPRDSLMLATARLAKVSVRVARTSIEIGIVLVGWLLGGPVGLGTLIIALTIGPAVQLAFRLLRVRPLQPVPITPLAADEM
jgi:uncharacterized membrane protein YczE